MPEKSKDLPEGFEHLVKDLYFRLDERDRWADHIIRFLFTVNGGGIAVVMAYAGVLARLGTPDRSLFGALSLFAVGLLLVGILLLASADHVRSARRKVRPLLVRVLNPDADYDYVAAFQDMGNRMEFPSKWRKFVRISLASFACFLVGLLWSFFIVTGVDASPPPKSAPPDSDTSTAREAAAGAKRLPDGPRPCAARTASHCKTSGKND